MVVEVLVDLTFVDEVREKLLEVPLASDEHEDWCRPLTRVVVDDDVKVIDLLDELLSRLLGEPEEKLVDHEHNAAEALRLRMRAHALEAFAPTRIDPRVRRIPALVQ